MVPRSEKGSCIKAAASAAAFERELIRLAKQRDMRMKRKRRGSVVKNDADDFHLTTACGGASPQGEALNEA